MAKLEYQRVLSSPADINPESTPLPEAVVRSRRQKFIDRDIEFSKRLAYCGQPVDLTKHHKILRFICRFLEFSGHGVPWFAVCIAKMATAIPSESIQFWTNIFYALIVDIAIVGTVKALFRRGRPTYAVQLNHAKINPDKFSFPSGHASRSVMMATLFSTRWINDPTSKILFIIWAFLVCLSRAVLGRHYVTDVVAGALLGIVVAALFHEFLWLSLQSCLWLLWPLHEYLFI